VFQKKSEISANTVHTAGNTATVMTTGASQRGGVHGAPRIAAAVTQYQRVRSRPLYIDCTCSA
jgi:D-tyrosyl-tRNA(Tyr) deacylase